MGRVLVVGDIHGAAKALHQVLERSGFDKSEDTLIALGDYVDGWSESFEVVEALLEITNLIAIKGNHDEWFEQYLKTGHHPQSVLGFNGTNTWAQGGEVTKQSYMKAAEQDLTLNTGDIPLAHIKFFKNLHHYYLDNDKRLFIHGGFNRFMKLKEHAPHVFWWDRELWYKALSCRTPKSELKTVEDFSEIFIGHTAVTSLKWGNGEKVTVPVHAAQVWNLDTGAGWDGKLTIMDVDTKEYWQSDLVKDLYPDEKGRS